MGILVQAGADDLQATTDYINLAHEFNAEDRAMLEAIQRNTKNETSPCFVSGTRIFRRDYLGFYAICGASYFGGSFVTKKHVNTLIVGGGQAGLAMSAHLGKQGVDHLILEKDRIAERWRTARWDSLVANGPAWHDRFPMLEFEDCDGDGVSYP